MPSPTSTWTEHPESTDEIGHVGPGFCFDNELPRHRVFNGAFALADQAVTGGEWLAFLDDGGYRRPELWLSDGWAMVQAGRWEHPFYWLPVDGGWQEFTLGGPSPINPAQPVCHLSYYEADAYAHWAGARLPTRGRMGSGRQRATGAGPLPGPDQAAPDPGLCRHGATPFGNVWQ